MIKTLDKNSPCIDQLQWCLDALEKIELNETTAGVFHTIKEAQIKHLEEKLKIINKIEKENNKYLKWQNVQVDVMIDTIWEDLQNQKSILEKND